MQGLANDGLGAVAANLEARFCTAGRGGSCHGWLGGGVHFRFLTEIGTADGDQTAHTVARHRRDQGAPVATVSRLTSRNRLRPMPNELMRASQPFKRNGLSP